MDEVITRRWRHIFPEWRWLHESQPISDHPVGLRFPRRAGWYRPGDHRVRPRFVGVVDVLKVSNDPGIRPYPPRLALDPRSSRQSAIIQWGQGFHTVRGGIDAGYHRFRPRFVGVVHVLKVL